MTSATRTGRTFATTRPRRAATVDEAAPATASARRYLRGGLPAIYQDGDFGMRFVGALETLLDPVVALLDNLPAHFVPELAPIGMVDLVCAWLGAEPGEDWPPERRRHLARQAAALTRYRGTRIGLELTLRAWFPDLPLRVEDAGGVSYSRDVRSPGAEAAPSFVVYCDKPVSEELLASIARVIDHAKPAHISHRLRARQTRRDGGAPA